MSNRKRPTAPDILAVYAAAGLAPDVRLGAKQRRLLAVLVTHADQVLRHEYLLQEVWGPHYDRGCIYLLHTLIKRLRENIGDVPPCRIVSVGGCGYRWIPARAGEAGRGREACGGRT